ncbi:MAG TPA: hypothetical protein VF765_29995 [Polyangiaceae bacterium]
MIRARASLFTCSIVLASLAGAATAAAQSSATGTAAPATARAAAQESYARGNRYFNQAEQKHDKSLYEAAYLQFTEAYAVYPNDKVLWNLAASEVKTGRYVPALGHLRTYDAHQHVTAQPSGDRATYQMLYDEAYRATGHLAVDAPASARVRVDGADAGVAPLSGEIDVQPGATHAIDALLPDGTSLHAQASPAAGDVAHVTLAAAPATAASPASTAPAIPAAAPVSPAASSEAPPPPRAPEEGGGFFTTRNTLALGLGVLALGALGTAVGFQIVAGNDQGRANTLAGQIPNTSNACGPGTTIPQCGQFTDANDAAHREQTTATALFVVGGVAALGTLAVLVFWPSRGREASWLPAPAVSPSLAGLEWNAAF